MVTDRGVTTALAAMLDSASPAGTYTRLPSFTTTSSTSTSKRNVPSVILLMRSECVHPSPGFNLAMTTDGERVSVGRDWVSGAGCECAQATAIPNNRTTCFTVRSLENG